MEENTMMMNAVTNDVMTNDVATNEVVKTVYVTPTIDKIKYASYGAIATLAVCWFIGRRGKKKEAEIRAQAVNKTAAANVEPGTTDFQKVADEK